MSHDKLVKSIKVVLFLTIVFTFIILLFYASRLYNSLVLNPKLFNLSNDSKPAEITLQEANIKSIIRNVVLWLNDIIPEAGKSEKRWHPLRFYFVDSYNFYVEYTNNVETRKILIRLKGESDKKENYEVVAHFKPGRNMWDLIFGEDLFFDKDKLVYEYNIDKMSWEIK